MAHAVERTSPMGETFFGRCIKCGQRDLRMDAALHDCPADKLLSDQQALVQLVGVGSK